jgi:CRISPR system Cascade subunit CasD
MCTLLLRLSGPMQSWGLSSNFTVRDTGLEPSKSGVIGLLCAALGRPRAAPLDDLALLRMGVRVDREGLLSRDYHTAGKGGYIRASGVIERKNLIVSTRYYLADAFFLVGLEGDLRLLTQLHNAVRDPIWSLYLGRKAFLPAQPIWLENGLKQDKRLLEVLHAFPWLGCMGDPPERVRLVLDDPFGGEIRNDLPISFARREFAARRICTEWMTTPAHEMEVQPCI